MTAGLPELSRHRAGRLRESEAGTVTAGLPELSRHRAGRFRESEAGTVTARSVRAQ